MHAECLLQGRAISSTGCWACSAQQMWQMPASGRPPECDLHHAQVVLLLARYVVFGSDMCACWRRDAGGFNQ
jgi:hypothetical protein